ncbi:MAG: hypothetical protein Athens101428_797 [Candidatus Berkelbacteria bacterium Athens1014_28]|uniref:Uncharacterized protein n=1 Tax=Candidatus Berkelbacteria bacterium Athens1014_28 TaxID=2017145 RepID=A0A554LIU6_9BACT|nr:MAG: hypothetical protein Athens101428_797 [Candidatus Berkelbacteria bacterium Athens1014_28]
MKVEVRVVPKARIEQITPDLVGGFKIWVRPEPKEGKANIRVTEILAKHFSVSKSRVKLISGYKSRTKIFEIDL